MEFSGFINNDFDYFRKKDTMNKTEYDQRKEEIKRHFREFCYELQRSYHSTSGGALILDKDFHGLNKAKSYISAKSKIEGVDFVDLNVNLCENNISLGLICPPDGDYLKFHRFRELIIDREEVFLKFFKENKEIFIIICSKNFKKTGDDTWVEEIKFENNELIHGDYKKIVDNMDKLKPVSTSKKFPGLHIRVQFSKSDAIRLGKMLAPKVCGEIIKLLNFSDAIR